ncbi:MAG: hypothetical protein ACYSYL_14760 [Planctomycetota bacterium]|jgi:hypothetical protein
MSLDFPLFLRQSSMPAYVRKAITEAITEVHEMEGIPEDDREAVGYCRAYLLWYSWHYYRGKTLVRDYVWDEMYKRLQWYESQWPQLVTPLSPTQRVGRIMES